MDELDDMADIIREFIDETNELLDMVSDDILALEQGEDAEGINRIYRAFHTIKGNSSMLGFNRLNVFGHKSEDLLSLIRNHELQVDKGITDLLLYIVDTIKQILSDIGNGGDDSRNTLAAIQLMDDIIQSTHEAKTEKVTQKSVEEKKAESQKVTINMAENFHENTHETPENQLINMDENTNAVEPELTQPITSNNQMYVHPVQNVDNLTNKSNITNHVPSKYLKILIVEDDFLTRQMMVKFLSQFGECHIAADGLEAIDAFSYSYDCDQPQPYDLICMDIVMPKMDGTRAAKTIREIERGKGVDGTANESVIIITSAVTDPTTIIKSCYECGANYYFVKPLDFRQMTRQLQKLSLIS